MAEKPIVALLYDFDSTLSKTDMQNFGFIPSLGLTPAEFWGKTGEFAAQTGCERTLAYLFMMKKLCAEKGIKLTRGYLNKMGEDIEFFNGVETWFKRINEFGRRNGIQVEHYLISSGNKEIVEGCKIAHEFKGLFACEFIYGEDGLPIWPKLAINYTQKTQYYYRISKGITDITDDASVNQKTPNRRVLYSNMIFIGDGMTDVPSMILAKSNHGNSIAVYQEGSDFKAASLYDEDRVNYICKADYSEGSEIEEAVKGIIKQISISENLKEKARNYRNGK